MLLKVGIPRLKQNMKITCLLITATDKGASIYYCFIEAISVCPTLMCKLVWYLDKSMYMPVWYLDKDMCILVWYVGHMCWCVVWCCCVSRLAMCQHNGHLPLSDGWTDESSRSHSSWHWFRHRSKNFHPLPNNYNDKLWCFRQIDGHMQIGRETHRDKLRKTQTDIHTHYTVYTHMAWRTETWRDGETLSEK